MPADSSTFIEIAAPQETSKPAHMASTDAARNVARLHRRIAQDLKEAAGKAPDFLHALKLHQLWDRIEASSRHRRWESRESLRPSRQ